MSNIFFYDLKQSLTRSNWTVCTPTRKCLAESETRLVENIQSSFPSANLNLIRKFAVELRLKHCETFLEIVNKMKRIELYF